MWVGEDEIRAYLVVFLFQRGAPVIIRVLVRQCPYLEGLFGSRLGGDWDSEHIVCAGQFSVFANRRCTIELVVLASHRERGGVGAMLSMLCCSGFVHRQCACFVFLGWRNLMFERCFA